MVKRSVLVACVVLASMFLVPAASFGMKMNIDPARAEVAVKQGEEKTGVVTVLNYDEESPIHVKAYLQDLVYLPDGSNDFLVPGSTPWSLNDWIKIGPTEFDIPPGKQETVRYVISTPKDAKGGRYGVIFFETSTPPSEFKQVGATVNVRLGTILLVAIDGTKVVKAKLTGMVVIPASKDKPFEVSWTVYNDSNILVRPSGSIKIIDAATKKELLSIDANKDKAGILPQTNRKFLSPSKDAEKLPKGEYFAQVVLDYGGEALLGGQSKFKIE